jgi:hypothetical protein
MHYCPRLSVRVRPLSVIGFVCRLVRTSASSILKDKLCPNVRLFLQANASRSPPAPVEAPFRVGRALLGLLLLKKIHFRQRFGLRL